MMRQKAAGLAGLVLYAGLAAWPFMGVPDPQGVIPGIAWQWIIRAHQTERLGFCFALMPLWCLVIHRLMHRGMPGTRQYLLSYSVINVPGLMTAGYLAYQLHSPDCLKACPSEPKMMLISLVFCTGLITAVTLSAILRLKKGLKA